MSKHTPGPWVINWYECTMDKQDVEHAKREGNLNAKIGDVLWRSPRSIGPCGSEHSHWGGDLLTVGEADACLIAAAPDLLEALKELLRSHEVGVHMAGNGLNKARAAIAKAEGMNKATGEQT